MIEKIAIKFLKSKLDVPVYMERPKTIPGSGSYIILERTSTEIKDRITTCTLAVQSYGSTMQKAAELSEMVVHAMDEMLGLDEVSSLKFENEYNFTDTSTKEYRYQAVFEITYKYY